MVKTMIMMVLMLLLLLILIVIMMMMVSLCLNRWTQVMNISYARYKIKKCEPTKPSLTLSQTS